MARPDAVFDVHVGSSLLVANADVDPTVQSPGATLSNGSTDVWTTVEHFTVAGGIVRVDFAIRS